MLMTWVPFMMGESCLSWDSDSCTEQSHYCSAQGCQRSCFKCVSLKIIFGHLSWTAIFQKQDLCWKKNGQKWEEMNIDDGHQHWQEFSRINKSTVLDFVGFLTSWDLVIIYSTKIKAALRIPPSLDAVTNHSGKPDGPSQPYAVMVWINNHERQCNR